MTSDRILYLECRSGISGDMTVAALLDLGADEKKLTDALESLPLEGYRIHISRVKKSGLDACDFAVILDAAHENHDHDMAYLHGDHQGHEEHDEHTHDGHVHHHDAPHDHLQDDHGHHHHDHHVHGAQAMHHAHEHRGLTEITEIIEAGNLSAGAKELALRIFDILADAEAKAHGVPKDQVHFHEVGAVDSIVDIVAAAVCLDDLAPDRIVVSPLSEGTGTIRCQHGILPIPVPAVSNIVTAHGLSICNTKIQGELITPTGAAFVAAVMQEHNELPKNYTIERVGIGAGKRDYEAAGILRAMWICDAETKKDSIVKLEANIDDATGEQLGYCMDRLMEAGAKDVSFVPIYMKKNRPAYELHVICAPGDVERLEEILFCESTTIGIRRIEMERTVMERQTETVKTCYGDALVKVCTYKGVRKIYPEYESVKGLCSKCDRSFCEVYQEILSACR